MKKRSDIMTNGLRLVTTKEDWDIVISRIGRYDFYHTFDYHSVSRKEDEDPVLVVYEDGDILIALPLLIRQIPGHDYRDATSVYGYSGPLVNELPDNWDSSEYHASLQKYFESHQIITVFSRLNPYISGQQEVLDGLGNIKTIGSVVNIDLTKDIEAQRSAYRRDTRSRVNKARRLMKVEKASSERDIRAFIDIYNETMQELNADEYYFFDENYFFQFLDCDGFETDILLARHNETGDLTGASMFVKTGNIIQYHLSGTRTAYKKLGPSRLLLDEMRVIGTEQGYSFLNLGGGYKSRNDALLDFKSSFSDDIRIFSVWNYIVIPDIYKKLNEIHATSDSDYFPAYRSRK